MLLVASRVSCLLLAQQSGELLLAGRLLYSSLVSCLLLAQHQMNLLQVRPCAQQPRELLLANPQQPSFTSLFVASIIFEVWACSQPDELLLACACEAAG